MIRLAIPERRIEPRDDGHRHTRACLDEDGDLACDFVDDRDEEEEE